MSRDVIITPASGLIDFRTLGISDASIELDLSGNLRISNLGGDLTIGDPGNNVYIGDGVNVVDLIFDQSGGIYAGSGKTLTLGSVGSSVQFATGFGVTGTVTATEFSGPLTGNASTATTLQTTRTIWGQNFNGSANVSGNISGATSILAGSGVSGAVTTPPYLSLGANWGTTTLRANCKIRLFENGADVYGFSIGNAGDVQYHSTTTHQFYNNDVATFTVNSTGATSTGIVQGTRFTSTVATGTAPLTVASTTLVTNLNADLLDGENLIDNAATANTVVGRDASGNITANQYFSTNNGSGTNYRIGDDCWIGDINVANTFRISGVQNSDRGYITFGSDNTALGRITTGALTWGGNTIWHAGNDGLGSGLDADLLDGVDSLTYSASLRSHANISGGGTITVDASGNVLWSSRFIVISNGGTSTAGATYFSSNGYFDITCPVTGTITGVGGAVNKTATAAGIPLGVWEALYYILPIGSNNTSLAANFRVSSYIDNVDIPHNWVLICVRNGDNGLFKFSNGITLRAGQSINTVTYDARRANFADQLTTARTINGTSFDGSANITITSNTPNSITFNNAGSGGASGSTFNGSAALTVSHNTIGALAITSSDYTRAPNDPGADFNTQTANSFVSSLNATSNTPFGNAWYNVINVRHRGGAGDGNVWGGQIAFGMTSFTDRMAFRVNTGVAGTWTAWRELAYSNQSFFIGTTSIALNRTSGAQSLTGITSIDGSAATWTTGRTIALTGDVTGTSGAFDGSANLSFATTLANSGVTAGTYRSVTVDVKGRVTAGTNPTTLSGYGITDALSNSTTSTQSGYFGDIFLYDDSTPSHYLGITNSANLTAARTLSLNVNDANRTVSLSGNLTLANNFTTAGNFALTFTTTAATSLTLPTSGTVATTSNNLGAFAATTSAQLAGVISDETGSGALVFGTSPSFTTSVATGSTTFGVFDATATTINAFGAATTLNLGYDGTAASTTNIVTGAINSGVKAINIGTGSAAGSTTTITLGTNIVGSRTISASATNTLQNHTVIGSTVDEGLRGPITVLQVNPSAGGSGYRDGVNVFNVTGGTGSGAQVTLSVGDGAILSAQATPVMEGRGYTQTTDTLTVTTPQTGIATTAASGTGTTATISFAAQASLATTAASGTGTVATLTFATQSLPPYPPGSTITVSGVTPTGYNGTYTVTACTTTTVSYSNTTTGAQTVAGTVSIHPFRVGSQVTIAGVTPTGYNATNAVVTAATATSVSYANTTTGAQTVAGTINQGTALISGTLVVNSVRQAGLQVINSTYPRIRLENTLTTVNAGTELGSVLFGCRDANVGGAGDKVRLIAAAEGTSGGGQLQIWTAANGAEPTLGFLFGGNNDFRLYNAAGTFYHTFSNSPTANRTITLPDANISFANAFTTAGNFALTLTTTATTNVTLPTSGTLAVNNQTMHVGTTAIAINRASATQTLTGVSIDGNAATATTLQNPRNINGISFNGSADINVPDLRGTNGTILIDGTGVTSGVNYVSLTNAITGGTVTLSTAGSDTNIPFQITTKGTGSVTVATAGGNIALRPSAGSILFYDAANSFYTNLDNGSLTANRTLTMPDANVTLVSGTMVPTSRTLTISTGSGLSGGAAAVDLSANRSWTLSVDSTVIRTSGSFEQNGALTIRNGANEAFIYYLRSNATANNKEWRAGIGDDSHFSIVALDDAGVASGFYFRFIRSGNAVQRLDFMNGVNGWGTIRNDTARMGLGTLTPGYRLDLPNTADVEGRGRSNQWVVHSDGRIKSNRETIPYGLETVMALQPIKYFQHNSKTDEDGNLIILDDEGDVAIGLVAQDVEEIIPEVVTAPEDPEKDLYALDYSKLTTVLIKAMQEQQAMIEELRAEIEVLKST